MSTILGSQLGTSVCLASPRCDTMRGLAGHRRGTGGAGVEIAGHTEEHEFCDFLDF